MGYGDGLASIIGKAIRSYEYKIGNTKKTLAGTLTMFIVTFIILSILLYVTKVNLWLIKTIIISIVVTIIEAISIKGTDNLSVPIATCLMLLCV